MVSLRPLHLFFMILISQPHVFAQQDLDVERARSRRDSAAAEAARAKDDYDRAAQRLRSEESGLRQAKQDEAQARNNLSSAERQLQTIESKIVTLDRQISELQFEISGLNSQLSTDRSDLQTITGRRDHLRQRVRHARQELEGIDAELARLNSDPEANREQIEQLQRRRQRAERELESEQSQLSSLENDVNEKQREVERKQQGITNRERDMANARNEIANLDRQRTRLLSDINYYRSEVNRAASQVRTSERNVELAQADVRAANIVYQREQSEAQSAQSYYDQVQANYNRELNAVYQRADLAARRDAEEQATGRATNDGTQAGSSDGRIGEQHGRSDGEAVAGLSGYRDARANPQLDNAAYSTGLANGRTLAANKARTEDYPLGYNAALQSFLARTPDREDTYDMTTDINFPAGETSPELSTVKLNVGRVADPAFPIANDPSEREPAVLTPSVSVPESPFGTPPCTGLILPEFEPLCRTRYRDSFTTIFRNTYTNAYIAAYRSAYAQVYRDLYATNRRGQYPASRTAGIRKGAEDQGVLVGFANQLTVARAAARTEGEAALNAKSQASHLVFVRSVRFSERDGNGLFSPGEPLDVSIVLDNIGAKATPDKKLRLKITGTTGVASVLYELRDLPSLPANTRLTLVGATTIKGGSVYGGDKVQVKGELQLSNGQAVHSFSLDQELRYDLELNDIALAKDPSVGEEVAAKIKFINQSKVVTVARQVTLAVVPKVADVTLAAPIDIPELAAGEEFIADAKVKPGVWVGENTFVNFQASMTSLSDPIETLVQPFKKFIHINRTASLLLFDRNNVPLENSRLVVRAGSTIAINAAMKYHSTRALPGPFVIKAANKSHPVISHPSNTTVSVNYGSWSPTRPMPTATIQYVIPESLRGQEAWVMLQLNEGNTTLHAPMIYLDVK